MKKRYEGDVLPKCSNEARKDVAGLMKSARLESRLTQEELAELTGTKKSNISRMESGRYNPSLDFMANVADKMGKKLVVSMK